jgi:hypothetical protein
VGSRAGLDVTEKRKILPLPGLELRPLGQSLYRLRYPTLRKLELKLLHLRDEVLTAVVMKNSVFWISCRVVLWTSTDVSEVQVATTFRLKSKLKKNQVASLLPASCWILVWLTLQPEGGGDMYLRNVGLCPTNYTVLYRKRQNSSVIFMVTAVRTIHLT